MKHTDINNNQSEDKDFELVYGRNPVLEVIENGSLQVNKIWISENFNDSNLRKRVLLFSKEKKVPHYIVPLKKLNSLTKSQNHQGLVLSISPVSYLQVSEIIKSTLENNESKTKTILIGHEIQDVHNLGAMIRTFVAGGGEGIILTGRSNPGINATVIKTSAGTIFQAKFAKAVNCVNVLNELKESGFWIVGTDNSPEAQSIYDIDYPDQTAIVVGNEHEGLGPHIRKNCDFIAKIPVSDKVDSLNVSVAFGIVLFEVLRQKKK